MKRGGPGAVEDELELSMSAWATNRLCGITEKRQSVRRQHDYINRARYFLAHHFHPKLSKKVKLLLGTLVLVAATIEHVRQC